MTHYKLITPEATHLLIVKNGDLIYCDPAFYHDKDGVGLSFLVVRWPIARGTFEGLHYQIIPLLDHVSTIEYREKKYAFLWKDDALVRITLSSEDETRDITWKELPKQLQKVLL